ncbi:EamA family transporter [Janibacter cremeus]|uniref:Drug/metabolite transporter (DMT)-like permease n=1 Tax=Janibacter cremeus TaxID=1285192 RepID=A0A852VJ62_9MICO|nr:drug/metabolite transporter (DMT)-like permease [Janibacter cremeus]
MTVVPPLPLLAISAVVEGPGSMWRSLTGSFSTGPQELLAWGGLAYTALVATVVGSGLWTWLMSRHNAGSVAPFSLLVPITGLTLAWALLGETPSPVELVGGVLVIIGVWATTRRRATLPPSSPTGAPRVAVPTGGAASAR